MVSNKAPFDRWLDSSEDAIDASAKRGFALFNTKGNCTACHSGWRFTDDGFHDIGLSDADLGRAGQAGLEHAFKTPTLRNIDQRGPYMHDGSVATLPDVVMHYDSGFVDRPSLSPKMRRLQLTSEVDSFATKRKGSMVATQPACDECRLPLRVFMFGRKALSPRARVLGGAAVQPQLIATTNASRPSPCQVSHSSNAASPP